LKKVTPRDPTILAERDLAALSNSQRSVRLALRPLQLFLSRVQRQLHMHPASVAVRFINDREMARLNFVYRKKKKTTDVLSFPSETRSTPRHLPARLKSLKGKYLGDIAISPVVARRNAKSFGRSLADELRILILHGVLHLLGYDHETDRGEMDRVEARLRRRLGLAG
jgi:probable rRNA maturation factor